VPEGLDTAGATFDERGVRVDARLRAGERLWAVGDVTGVRLLTHVGEYPRGRCHPHGRDPGRLKAAGDEVGAQRTAAFDATDPAALDRFFAGLPGQIDHVLVTGPGPYYAPLAELDRERAHRDFDDHVWLAVAVAQHAGGRVRPGGNPAHF
jgi:hypothetical protein